MRISNSSYASRLISSLLATGDFIKLLIVKSNHQGQEALQVVKSRLYRGRYLWEYQVESVIRQRVVNIYRRHSAFDQFSVQFVGGGHRRDEIRLALDQ